MFEQENLQGWSISHIISSWHRDLAKAHAAMALSFKHSVETSPGKQQQGGEHPQTLLGAELWVCFSQKMFTEGAERLWPGASLLVFLGKALCRVSDMTEKKTWYQGEHNHALPAKKLNAGRSGLHSF